MAEPVAGAEVALPATPDGWFDHGYAILMDGALAILRTSYDVHAHMRAAYESGFTRQTPLPAYRMHVVSFDGATESEPVELPKITMAPVVERFADGRWLAVARRTQGRDANAFVFTSRGDLSTAFHVGDGIQHVRCAPDGAIWVGYFDEGVFGEQDEDGNWPVSSSGIAQYSDGGALLWRFNEAEPTPGIDEQAFVSDCYGLTLAGSAIWSSTYTDFWISRMQDGGKRSWRTGHPPGGYTALAIDGDHVLLAGGYGETDRISVVRLRHDKPDTEIVATRRIGVSNREALLMQGLDDTLHIVANGRWLRIRVRDVLAGSG